jgi:hypothetical protein
MKRVFIFSPYASRHHLTAYEATIAKACQKRGAMVEYLLCDGLLPECDMHWDSFPSRFSRPLDLCARCQAGTKNELLPFAFPQRWLGEFVPDGDKADAFAWAQSLTPSQLENASFRGQPIGHWVQSSVVSYFRQYPLDFSNWRVTNVYRGFVYSGALVAVGLRNYLRQHPVDSALLFNGRQSLTRVAFEVFRAGGVRVLTHEYPFYKQGHINVKPNARCWSIDPFNEFWRSWKDVALTRSELETTLNWLRDRRYGRGFAWYAFNKPYSKRESLREKLKISEGKRLLALFTSSTDETVGDPDLQGAYGSQYEWIEDVLAWTRDRSDVELVIRVHPHLAGNEGLGQAEREREHFRGLSRQAPQNVRVIPPEDPLSSYALADEADIGLVFSSTIGFEMAMLGRPVVVASRAIFEELSNVLTVRSRDSIQPILEKSLEPVSAREIRREAFRFAYLYVFKFEFAFPLVAKTGAVEVKLAYRSFEELNPGKDPALDRICGYLIDGAPVYELPEPEDLRRSRGEEDAFFRELEQMADPMRDVEYEKWLRRSAQAGRLGRSIQATVLGLPLGLGAPLNRLGKAIYSPMLRFLGRKTWR